VFLAAVFFLQQTPAEFPEAEAALEWECLPAAESPQVERASLPPLAAVEEEGPPRGLRVVEKPQPLPGEFLKLHRLPSRNTIAAVADK